VRIVAEPRFFLLLVKGLHGGIEIEDPGRAQQRFVSPVQMQVQPQRCGIFVDVSEGATDAVFAAQAGQPQ